MNDISFAAFTRNMYAEAMKERRAYLEKEISYEEYILNNLDLLYERYQVRETLDD